MGTFESLKREAVHLERQLEDKVGRYQQLAQKSSTANKNGDSLLSKVESGEAANVVGLGREVDLLLQNLGNVIKKLVGAAVTPSQKAVAQRYQDIWQDLRSDYEKSVMAYTRAAERQELLAGAGTADSGGATKDAAMESLLRERSHINNSMNATDDVLGQAESVRADLHWQGRSLRNTGGVMGQISNNVPGLNTLIEAIRRRRSRDDKIVAATIASCIVFTLWYIFG